MGITRRDVQHSIVFTAHLIFNDFPDMNLFLFLGPVHPGQMKDYIRQSQRLIQQHRIASQIILIKGQFIAPLQLRNQIPPDKTL
jgi:hypothetical protein